MLAGLHPALVELPELGALALGVPLAEGVAERQHPLLGPGLVLVPAGAAEAGVEGVLGDGVEQGGGLEPVAAGAGPGVGHPARGRSSPGPLATSSRSPSSATWLSRYSMTSAKLWPVSMCRIGKGKPPGRKALAARCSRTAESLPPLKRSTGRSDSAATSRRMKMAWDSSRSRWSTGGGPRRRARRRQVARRQVPGRSVEGGRTPRGRPSAAAVVVGERLGGAHRACPIHWCRPARP